MADLRECIGSKRYGIEPHEAPIADFPTQPSQKDGFGRLCKPHWRQYTSGLARDRRAATGATQAPVATETPEAPKDTTPKRRGPYKATPAAIRELETHIAGKPAPKPSKKARTQPFGRKAIASAEEPSGAQVQRELLEKVRANGGSLPATPQTFD